MRLMPILTALIVTVVLYFLVLERQSLLEFAGVSSSSDPAAEQDASTPQTQSAETGPADVPAGTVRVMAMRSVAEIVGNAVVLRGETEALRQVDVRAETGGKIVSEPLRRGSYVEAGQLLCALDPGTRDVSLQEAEARLAEAKARVPESGARLTEAQAQVPATRARIAEAKAAVPAAEARLREALAAIPAAEARLIEARSRVPESEARLREAEAAVPAAEAALKEAEARVPTAEAALAEAKARRPEADARLLEAEARVREAEINLNAAKELAKDGFAAQTRLASAEAAYESAKAQVLSAQSGQIAADAAIQAAMGQVEGAKAAVQSAKSQVQSALAGVQSAASNVENAKAGIETAMSNVEGSKAAVESATSAVEGARAAVISAEAQLEGALASIEAAKAGESNALSGIQSAEAGLASANKDIERLEIIAPFSGLLETDTAELGALLQPGSSCATVIQLDPIKIVGFVPEAEVHRVELGAKAGARLVDGREVFGQVKFVSRSADPLTRTFRVELEVANGDLSIRDGQTAEIAIEAEGAPAHLLPQSTLTLNNGGALGVRIITPEEKALFAPVSLLRDTTEGVWVAGLPDEANVITVGQEYVTDGVPVAPSYEEIFQ